MSELTYKGPTGIVYTCDIMDLLNELSKFEDFKVSIDDDKHTIEFESIVFPLVSDGRTYFRLIEDFLNSLPVEIGFYLNTDSKSCSIFIYLFLYKFQKIDYNFSGGEKC